MQVFAPSLDLLVKWHMQYGLVFERNPEWQTAGRILSDAFFPAFAAASIAQVV